MLCGSVGIVGSRRPVVVRYSVEAEVTCGASRARVIGSIAVR